MKKEDCTDSYLVMLAQLDVICRPNAKVKSDYKDDDGNNLVHLTLAKFSQLSFLHHEMLDVFLSYILGCGLAEKVIEKNKDKQTPLQYMYQHSIATQNPSLELLGPSISIIEQNTNYLFSGVKVTNNFTLFYGSKNKHKRCVISDADQETENDSITLHSRLKITRDHYGSVKTDWRPGYNQLVGNIGFVVSTPNYIPKAARKSSKDDNHGRRFVTIPIKSNKWQVFKNKPHTEQTLYEFMATSECLDATFDELSKKGYSSGKCKIYGLVLDIYSDEAMCLNCQLETLRMLGGGVVTKAPVFDLTTLIESKAIQREYHLPKVKESNLFEVLPFKAYKLRFSIRVSAFRTTNVGCDSEYAFDYNVFQGANKLKENINSNSIRDIKKHARRMIFHSMCSEPGALNSYHHQHRHSSKNVAIYKNTVFSTSGKNAYEMKRESAYELYQTETITI